MPELDAEELFHLALKASEKGDNDKAIIYLKDSINLQPRAESIYVLGAEYAEIGMFPRAIQCMEKALSLNPELHTARFQCGLLYMLQNQSAEALNTWLPLGELPQEEPLYQFATGLSLVLSNNQTKAIAALQKGIALNKTNPALNRDMQNVISRLQAALQATSDITASTAASDTGTESSEDIARKAILIRNYGAE